VSIDARPISPSSRIAKYGSREILKAGRSDIKR
jgi:hypothetical protein